MFTRLKVIIRIKQIESRLETIKCWIMNKGIYGKHNDEFENKIAEQRDLLDELDYLTRLL